jgi:hypothetical protein
MRKKIKICEDHNDDGSRCRKHVKPGPDGYIFCERHIAEREASARQWESDNTEGN